ncbi:MAG TPA: hypothetical protein VFQ88_02135 [Nevskiaceae bacterium]|nr:hypothetical protein [Nevskiaceae bacterium]
MCLIAWIILTILAWLLLARLQPAQALVAQIHFAHAMGAAAGTEWPIHIPGRWLSLRDLTPTEISAALAFPFPLSYQLAPAIAGAAVVVIGLCWRLIRRRLRHTAHPADLAVVRGGDSGSAAALAARLARED